MKKWLCSTGEYLFALGFFWSIVILSWFDCAFTLWLPDYIEEVRDAVQNQYQRLRAGSTK